VENRRINVKTDADSGPGNTGTEPCKRVKRVSCRRHFFEPRPFVRPYAFVFYDAVPRSAVEHFYCSNGPPRPRPRPPPPPHPARGDRNPQFPTYCARHEQTCVTHLSRGICKTPRVLENVRKSRARLGRRSFIGETQRNDTTTFTSRLPQEPYIVENNGFKTVVCILSFRRPLVFCKTIVF